MVTVLELGLLRILNEKNSDKALEFPVKAFSALIEFEQLSLEEIAETTELDSETILPLLKKLVKQRILSQKGEKFAINKKLNELNRIIS